MSRVTHSNELPRPPVPAPVRVPRRPVPDVVETTQPQSAAVAPSSATDLEANRPTAALLAPVTRALKATRRSFQQHFVIWGILETVAGATGAGLVIHGSLQSDYSSYTDTYLSPRKPTEMIIGGILIAATVAGAVMTCCCNPVCGGSRRGGSSYQYDDGLEWSRNYIGAQNAANMQMNTYNNQVWTQNNSVWASS